MQYLKLKNIKKVHSFFIYEKASCINKYILINLINASKNFKVVDKIVSTFLVCSSKKKKKNYSKVRILRRCLISNRNRAVLRSYGFSRIVFRNFAQLGILPGYKKAV